MKLICSSCNKTFSALASTRKYCSVCMKKRKAKELEKLHAKRREEGKIHYRWHIKNMLCGLKGLHLKHTENVEEVTCENCIKSLVKKGYLEYVDE